MAQTSDWLSVDIATFGILLLADLSELLAWPFPFLSQINLPCSLAPFSFHQSSRVTLLENCLL